MIGGASTRLDDAGEVVDGLRDGEVGDDVRVLAQRFDLDLEPRIRRGEDAVALRLVVRLPALPAARRHPEAVYENDGVARALGLGH